MVKYIYQLLRILQDSSQAYEYGKCGPIVQRACDESFKASDVGDYDSAIKAGNRAILAGLDCAEGYEAVANAYLTAMDPAKALKALNYLLRKFPTASVGLGLMGYLLGESGQLREAVKFLELSLKYGPHNTDAIRNLGWYYFELGEASRGEAPLLRALSVALGRESDLILVDLAYLKLRSGAIAQAWQYYEKAKLVCPAGDDMLAKLRSALDSASKTLSNIPK